MISDMEPRRIEPLIPCVKYGCRTRRWPLELHKTYYNTACAKQKARTCLADTDLLRRNCIRTWHYQFSKTTRFVKVIYPDTEK